ncbi:type II toxin-antitoxin system PemK/MazF family toxin [Elstera litoralis]|uniref:type II toxin-antitoxin system PemK/MazF family toxin n=1 Tax=Elstera litoralis TaxID=552518 RepID=UPI0009FC1BE8|nr:type II toxin-antitoxin system PemK/MazF family toxin [Elstera litoralis]
MRRGDLVTVALAGDFGKPRPALILQSDLLAEHDTVIVALVTSALIPAPLVRISVEPTPANGLSKTSQIMVDKVMTVRREKLGPVFGCVEEATLIAVNHSLALVLGFG